MSDTAIYKKKTPKKRKGLYEFLGLFLALLAAFIIWQAISHPTVTVKIDTTPVQTSP